MELRGPDAEGVWECQGVFLGHRRLAVIDLDERSSQPFHSSCGRYVIVFNGEIYNYRALRDELQVKGLVFRTTSDTEVLLNLFISLGEAMLPRLHGMFAFVVWDKLLKEAFAARDPYGIKPLYLSEQPRGGVLFASQVRSLIATGLPSREPDPVGQAGYWMLGSVPEPHTWYQSIRSVSSGACIWVREGRAQAERRWHDIGEAWRGAQLNVRLSREEVFQRTQAALIECVGRHLVSDVSVGVFLSGGIDSTVLAALMRDSGAKNIQGITLKFDEFSGLHDDEVPAAAWAAVRYGIRHHVRRVTRLEFEGDIPRILQAMDQPTVDGVNTWYASKAAAELGLKVVVSGVGGDELFLGYASFVQVPTVVRRWGNLSSLPGATPTARAFGAWRAKRTHNLRWRHAHEWAKSIEGGWWLRRSLAAPEDLPSLMGADLASEALRNFSPLSWVRTMVGQVSDDATLALAQIESLSYLRNQLLRDSDWASMNHSLELRTPLVDAHLLSSLAPCLQHFASFPEKVLLAQAPSVPLPKWFAQRRKSGFGIPVKQWTTNPASQIDRSVPHLSGWSAWMTKLASTYTAGP